MQGRIALRNLHYVSVEIVCVATDASSFSRKGEQHIALGQCLLHPLALCDVDVDADHALSATISMVGDEGTRLDPSDRTERKDDSIFRMLRAFARYKSWVAARSKRRQVIRMDARTPLVEGDLRGFRWKSLDGRIARRDLYSFRVHV